VRSSGPAVVSLGIDVGPIGEKRLHHIEVAVFGGLEARISGVTPSSLSLALPSAPVGEKHMHHIEVPFLVGSHQRGHAVELYLNQCKITRICLAPYFAGSRID
jgi:hypothetical protein